MSINLVQPVPILEVAIPVHGSLDSNLQPMYPSKMLEERIQNTRKIGRIVNIPEAKLFKAIR